MFGMSLTLENQSEPSKLDPQSIKSNSTLNYKYFFILNLKWVSAATENGIRVWDLGSDSEKPIADLTCEPKRKD
jgi:hypothetical protein